MEQNKTKQPVSFYQRMSVGILKTFITVLISFSATGIIPKYFLQHIQFLCQFLQNFNLYPTSRCDLLYGGGRNPQIAEEDTFKTFPEAAETIKHFCEKNYHPIKIARSGIYDNSNPDFYYRFMVYSCVHFGLYKSKGKGLRRKTKTYCTDCRFVIKLRLMFEPQFYYRIFYCFLKHNHEIGPQVYGQYVKNRSLTEEEKDFVKEMLRTNAKSGEIALFVQENMNKMVVKSDISNLYAVYKRTDGDLFINKKDMKYDKEYFIDKWRKLQEPKNKQKYNSISYREGNSPFNPSHCSTNIMYDSEQFENMGYDPLSQKEIEYKFHEDKNVRHSFTQYPAFQCFTERLANLLCECPDPEREKRLHILTYLTEVWEHNGNVYLLRKEHDTYIECMDAVFTPVNNCNRTGDLNLDHNIPHNTEQFILNEKNCYPNKGGSSDIYILASTKSILNKHMKNNQEDTYSNLNPSNEAYSMESSCSVHLRKNEAYANLILNAPSRDICCSEQSFKIRLNSNECRDTTRDVSKTNNNNLSSKSKLQGKLLKSKFNNCYFVPDSELQKLEENLSFIGNYESVAKDVDGLEIISNIQTENVSPRKSLPEDVQVVKSKQQQKSCLKVNNKTGLDRKKLTLAQNKSTMNSFKKRKLVRKPANLQNKLLNTRKSVIPPVSSGVKSIDESNTSYNSVPSFEVDTIVMPNPMLSNLMFQKPKPPKSASPIIQNLPGATNVVPPLKPLFILNKTSNPLIQTCQNRFILPLPTSEKDKVGTATQRNVSENKTVSTQTGNITPEMYKKTDSGDSTTDTIPFISLYQKSSGENGTPVEGMRGTDSKFITNNSDCVPSLPIRLKLPNEFQRSADKNIHINDSLSHKSISYNNVKYVSPVLVTLPPSLISSKIVQATDSIVPAKSSDALGNASLGSVQMNVDVLPAPLIQKHTTIKQTTTAQELQNLKKSLTITDIEDIVSERMLNDKIINLGQVLIKVKFPTACGLQDVLLGSSLSFKVLNNNFVQVLHCGSFPHWITVSTINAPPATAYVYDSLNESVPRDAIPQICSIMNIQSSTLTTISKPMQLQLNNVDCGLFALASTLTLLAGKDPSLTIYDVDAMRQHLLSGLIKSDLHEFPTLKNGILARSVGVTETFHLHCLCRQPLSEGNMYRKLKEPYQCTKCHQWYHRQCKEQCCIFVDASNDNIS